VIKVGEQLQAIDSAAADPDGLVTSARAELAAEYRAAKLAADYHTGLRLIDAGRWREAAEALERVTRLDSAYQNALPLLDRARQELGQAAALAEEQDRRQAEEQARREAAEKARKRNRRTTPPGSRRPTPPEPGNSQSEQNYQNDHRYPDRDSSAHVICRTRPARPASASSSSNMLCVVVCSRDKDQMRPGLAAPQNSGPFDFAFQPRRCPTLLR
jgi:hypothetical protein